MNDEALVRIYRDTVRPLYATVSSWTRGDRALTEDVVQETYLRAVSAWRDTGPPARPAAWLRTVARNLLVSEWRHARPAALVEDPGAAPGGVALIDRLALEEGLEGVGSARASLLQAFHVEGRSVNEIARARGVSGRAIEGRLRRAREALRRALSRSPSPQEYDDET